jgi:hypothetical protein
MDFVYALLSWIKQGWLISPSAAAAVVKKMRIETPSAVKPLGRRRRYRLP